MLFSFNQYFHYFFVTFFAFSAILFWYLDRKRWVDYRKAAQKLGLRFSQSVTTQLQMELSKQFDFFSRETLEVYSARFNGSFQQRTINAFHYAFQGSDQDFSFRRGFACLTIASSKSLPQFRLWPASRHSPFPKGSQDLHAFFPNSRIKDHFEIRGPNGHAIYQALSEKVMSWLIQQTNVVMECQKDAILIALEDEWSPTHLLEMLQACFACLEFLETSVEMNST